MMKKEQALINRIVRSSIDEPFTPEYTAKDTKMRRYRNCHCMRIVFVKLMRRDFTRVPWYRVPR